MTNPPLWSYILIIYICLKQNYVKQHKSNANTLFSGYRILWLTGFAKKQVSYKTLTWVKGSYSEVVFRNGVFWSQFSVFCFLKIWYDDNTARLERFTHIVLKLSLGLQNLCSLFRFVLFDGISSWADFKKINRHIPSCYYLW